LKDLNSDQTAVRLFAVKRLAESSEEGASVGLMRALEDEDAWVRSRAVRGLGDNRCEGAIPGLIKALGDVDANVRGYAARALGQLKAGSATGKLFDALDDPNWFVRNQAAWALKRAGDASLLDGLAARLREKNADSSQLLWLIQELAGERTVRYLAPLLDDQNPSVRLRIAEMLFSLKEEEALEALAERKETEADPRVAAVLDEAVFLLSREGDLSAHWSFDEKEKMGWDATGRGNDGEVRGALAVPGKVGQALRFQDGAYVELGHPPTLRIGGTPLTVMAWVFSEAPNGVIVVKGGAFCGVSLYIMDKLPKLGIHRIQDGPAFIAAGEEDVTGRWVHLAGVVKDRSLELYVNGKQVGSAETDGLIPGECGQGMQIGWDEANSPAEITDAFQGVIDEVKIYGAALSEKEIAEQCEVKK